MNSDWRVVSTSATHRVGHGQYGMETKATEEICPALPTTLRYSASRHGKSGGRAGTASAHSTTQLVGCGAPLAAVAPWRGTLAEARLNLREALLFFLLQSFLPLFFFFKFVEEFRRSFMKFSAVEGARAPSDPPPGASARLHASLSLQPAAHRRRSHTARKG